ncbi:vomeronasal 1 receptor monDomV1R1234 [Monodelphis domestica]|uniref:Vomeronasal type-1 receptor n=1 Tax=Monodelphis domestica TaxID=13616 RepID=F7EX64_MONDO|nr:vomeronasal 1 receptor monDomV1R1234 [Monodelphis domestica]
MSPLEIIRGIVFCSQTATGVLGNSFLVFLFIFMFLTAHKLRPIDTILIQLAWANSLMLLFKGVPQTMVALRLKNFLDDTGCKIVLYLQRVARALSLSMTCFLSGFQAITISPSTSRYIKLKNRTQKSIIPCSVLCWTSHLILNVIILVKMKGTRTTRNNSNLLDFEYCSTSVASTLTAALFSVMASLPDVTCVGLIVFASGYMMFLLKRHQKRVQHIHVSSLSPRASPEIRATQSIQLLVNTFVFFYSLNFVLVIYMHLKNPRPWLLHSSNFLAGCFPNICPFVLISTDSQVIRYFYALLRHLHLLPSFMSSGLRKVSSPW